MTIEMAGKNRIIVLLSEADLKSYHTDFSALGTSNMHGRHLINEVLSLAQKKTGISFSNKKITIEALSCRFGCMMIITVSKKRRLYRILRREEKSVCFVFADEYGVLCCLGLLYLSGMEKQRCSLYRENSRLILVLPLNKKSRRIIPLVQLFASECSSGCGKLTEQADTVFADNAVSVAGRLIFGQ